MSHHKIFTMSKQSKRNCSELNDTTTADISSEINLNQDQSTPTRRMKPKRGTSATKAKFTLESMINNINDQNKLIEKLMSENALLKTDSSTKIISTNQGGLYGEPNIPTSLSTFPVLHGNTWASRKQKCVALSSAESEYIAAAEGAKEALWALSWIKEVFGVQKCATILCDNKAAICLTNNDSIHDRSKHIDIKYHFLRDEQRKNHLKMEWIETAKQLADILTKAVTRQIHMCLRQQLLGELKSS